MELQRSSAPPDQFTRQGKTQTRALHPFAIPFGLAPEKRCRPELQILRSHRGIKALTGELQNAMVATVAPSKAELNRHGSIGVLASVVEQLIQRQHQGPRVGLNHQFIPPFDALQLETRRQLPRIGCKRQPNPLLLKASPATGKSS